MNLDEFLKELAKPRKQRKWIERETYWRLLREYRKSPEVLNDKRLNESIDSKLDRSKRYKRFKRRLK